MGRTLTDLEKLHLYPEEMEFTSDSFSIYFDYLDEQIFKLKIIGQVEEETVRKISQIGGKIIDHYKSFKLDEELFFLVDTNQIQSVSIKAGRMLMRHQLPVDVNISIYAPSRAVKRSLAYLSLNNFKRKNIRVKQDETDALLDIFEQIGHPYDKEVPLTGFYDEQEPDYEVIFEKLWQEDKKMISIGDYQYRRVMRDNWSYTTPDGRFHSDMSVIEGNIVLINFEGFAHPIDVDRTYDMLADIVETFKFGEKKNKIYSINDLRKLRGITLKARKKTTLYEVKFQRYSQILISIPSPLAGFLIKMLKKLYPKQYKLWVIMKDRDEAFNFLKKYHSHNLSIDKKYFHIPSKKEEKLVIPDSKKELIALVKKQHEALQQEKKNKERQLETLHKITGQMSLNESFDQFINEEVEHTRDSLFADVLKTIKLLQDDFREVIRERDYQTRLMRESEEKYRSVVDLASDIIAMIQNEKIVFINNAAVTISGFTRDELLFQPFVKFIERPDTYRRLNKIFMQSEQEHVNMELNFYSKDQRLIPLSVSAGKIQYQKKPALMIIARDITDRKRYEAELEEHRKNLEKLVQERTAELKKAKERAEESDKLKSAFLANMSHEIRTPMNAIMGFSALLAENDKNNENKDYYINLIRKNGRELLSLVNDVINLAKIEAGQLDVKFNSFNLKSLLIEIFSEATEKYKSEEHNQAIDFRFRYNREHIIKSDRERIKEIIENLLSNAFKFTERGSVELGAYQQDSRIAVYVKDTGIGLDENEKKYIFERFRKVGSSRDKIYGGTGLGLSISQGMAEMLEGEITLESDKASGSVFYLILPYRDTDYEKAQIETDATDEKSKTIAAREKGIESDWSDKKILMVEDTYVNYLFMRAALLETGVNMELKETGEEALEHFEKAGDVDLVLMDIRLPGMNGYEVAEKIHAKNPKVPIIAQTAYAMKGDREKSLNSGCVDYIAKPMSPKELVQIVGKYLDK